MDVVLQEAVPGWDPVETVLKGGAKFGVGNSDLLLLRNRGEPVGVLAAIFQHSPLVLLVRAGHDGNVAVQPRLPGGNRAR